MTRNTLFGLFYAAAFGIAAFVTTVLAVLVLKASNVDLVTAWMGTVEDHALLIVFANIGGFIFGRKAAQQKI